MSVVVTLRNNSLVPPKADFISAKAVGHANGMSFPMSLRALLNKRDKSKVQRVGVWIWTPTGQQKTITQPTYWYDRLFGDRWGVATFFREMSGGRKFVEWKVFDAPIMTAAQKAAADNSGGGPPGVVDAFRSAAQAAGQVLSDYDRYMWVLDDGNANGGTTPSDTLMSAKDGSVQEFCHEMTHGFGLQPHADKTTFDDYNDPFCIMGRGPVARSFENTRLNVDKAPYDFGVSGPGICAPYLYALGWLDYETQVNGIAPDALAENTGAALITIFANQGGTSEPNRRYALAIGNVPHSVADATQYWIEYRHTDRFDREIDRPVVGKTPDFPPEGVVVLHALNYASFARYTGLHSFEVDAVAARQNSILQIKALGVSIRVVDVAADAPSIVVAIDRL